MVAEGVERVREREREKNLLWHAARPLPVQTEGLLRAPAGRPLRNCFLWVRKTTKKGKLLVSGNTRRWWERGGGGGSGWRGVSAFEVRGGLLGGGQQQNKWMEMCLLKGRFSVRRQEGPSVYLNSLLTPCNWAPANAWCLPLLAESAGRVWGCSYHVFFILHCLKSCIAHRQLIF